MGNWSINPNALASIDNNGKAIFQEHTEDVEYTITYNDNVTGALTKKFMVYGCGVDCNKVYKFSTITSPLDGHQTTPIAWSIDSLEQLTYTIKDSGGFLTGITVVHTADRWQYMGYFNTTTSTSDRTATIEYKNGDGTCTFRQELIMKGEMDCLLGGPNSITVPSNVTIADIGFSSSCGGEVPIEVVDQGTLENVVITHTSGIEGKITFTFNGSTNTWLKVKQINGTGTLTTQVYRQVPTSDVTISWGGLPSSLSTGGLQVTGSTYTANFILAGPNPGKGTLYGTLTADTRDKMTFSGQFTTSGGGGGGNIDNKCPGYQGEIYTVTSATWDYSNKRLSVGFSKCS